MRLGFFPPRLGAAATSLAILGACGGSSEPTGPPVPTSLTLVSGGNQAGTVGGALPLPVVVLVQGRGGPMAGVSVRFVVEGGNGTVSRGTVATDANGQASVVWSLGITVGQHGLRVSTSGLPELTVRATAAAGPPSLVTPVAGNSQFAVVKRAVAIRPRVRITDAFGNALPGHPVVFSVVEGGGTIADSVHTSDASGEATLGSWTLGPAAGLNRVRVASGALAGELVAFGTPNLLIPAGGDAQSVNAGTVAPVQPAVQAVDGDGAPLANVLVTFAVQSGGGSVFGASQTTDVTGIARVGGWIVGLNPGPNVLEARVPGVAPALFTATGILAVPANVIASGGDGLAGFFGNFLSGAPTVRVTDASGNAVAGAAVTFEVVAGGGSVVAASSSNFEGKAALLSWRLGSTETSQSVRAVVGSLPPIDFTATAGPLPPPAFDIDVRFVSTPTATQQTAFTNAATRWEQFILGDLVDIPFNVAAGNCLPVAMNETIDDVVIFADLVDIDGIGGVLGSAGPCYIRTAGSLTVVGRMRLDNADLTRLEGLGQLEAVIIHEMGHVLGFGTLWDLLDLVQGEGGGDPFFTGAGARAAFAAAAAPALFSGNAVPLENVGGPGTRDVHWRESRFDTELMTGIIDQGLNPLSAISTTSMRDLGYVVNDAVSEPYTLASLLVGLAAPAFRLVEEPLPWPIYAVSRSGRIDRIFLR